MLAFHIWGPVERLGREMPASLLAFLRVSVCCSANEFLGPGQFSLWLVSDAVGSEVCG